MPFEYSCFISYRRGQEELTQRFINELAKALKSYIEPYLDEKIFIDEGGLQGGDFYNEGLAEALCKSVCMVLVYTPTYFSKKHTFCAREYVAMKQLEKERFNFTKQTIDKKRGLIIPIIFRGPNYLPAEIKDQRHFYDFSTYTLVQPVISNNRLFVEEIEEIAKRIREIYDSFMVTTQDPIIDCEQFMLPADEDIREWLEGVIAPNRPFPFT